MEGHQTGRRIADLSKRAPEAAQRAVRPPSVRWWTQYIERALLSIWPAKFVRLSQTHEVVGLHASLVQTPYGEHLEDNRAAAFDAEIDDDQRYDVSLYRGPEDGETYQQALPESHAGITCVELSAFAVLGVIGGHRWPSAVSIGLGFFSGHHRRFHGFTVEGARSSRPASSRVRFSREASAT